MTTQAAEVASPPAAPPPAAPAASTPAAAPAAAAAAPAAGAPAATAPTKLELKFPEGFKQAEGLTKLATELGLDSAKAQKLVDAYAGDASAQQAALAKQQADWVAAIKADKDIGGANLEANLAVAKKAVAHFGGADFAQYLNASGLGDHPALVKAFVKIGQAMADDSVAGSVGSTASSAPQTDPLQQLYPSMFKKE